MAVIIMSFICVKVYVDCGCGCVCVKAIFTFFFVERNFLCLHEIFNEIKSHFTVAKNDFHVRFTVFGGYYAALFVYLIRLNIIILNEINSRHKWKNTDNLFVRWQWLFVVWHNFMRPMWFTEELNTNFNRRITLLE